MESASTTTTVANILKGDRYLDGLSGWRALEDAKRTDDGLVTVRVEYIPDGGHGQRVFSNPAHQIAVQR